jgi:hypothetical protein
MKLFKEIQKKLKANQFELEKFKESLKQVDFELTSLLMAFY